MKEGFIVGKGNYAAIPFGNQLMVIYNGEQLKVCRTENSARNFINEHKKQQKTTSVTDKKLSTTSTTKPKKQVKSTGKQNSKNARSRRSTSL